MIMGQPVQYPVMKTESVEVRFAYDENLNDVKRGIMIDRLTSDAKEPDLIPKLLKLYRKTNRVEVKDKVIENLMLYNQQHRKDELYITKDRESVKSFFAELLNSKSLTHKGADNVIRGFIDTHSPEEIKNNR